MWRNSADAPDSKPGAHIGRGGSNPPTDTHCEINLRNKENHATLISVAKTKETMQILPVIDMPLSGVSSCDIPKLVPGWDRDALELFFSDEYGIDVTPASDRQIAVMVRHINRGGDVNALCQHVARIHHVLMNGTA